MEKWDGERGVPAERPAGSKAQAYETVWSCVSQPPAAKFWAGSMRNSGQGFIPEDVGGRWSLLLGSVRARLCHIIPATEAFALC